MFISPARRYNRGVKGAPPPAVRRNRKGRIALIRIDADFDYTNALVEGWNHKLRSVRIASFIISILLVVCALLCAFFPVQSAGVMGALAAILILALGVYQLIDYFCAPPFLREAGGLVSSVLNLLIGVLLLASPTEATLSTFAFLLGGLMLVFGINKLSFSSKLGYFGVSGYGWVVVSGVLNLLAALSFLLLPLFSALVLNYLVAGYLLVGGVTLFIEAIAMRDLKVR